MRGPRGSVSVGQGVGRQGQAQVGTEIEGGKDGGRLARARRRQEARYVRGLANDDT